MKVSEDNILENGGAYFHPGFSVDCVIFGFHENQLKVLLLKMKQIKQWSLPGGFVFKDEDVDVAANRILKDRTGIDNVFLQQFHLFGAPERNDVELNRKILKVNNIHPSDDHWFLQRFITVGYYALVEFSRVTPRPDDFSETCEWQDINDLPEFVLDHRIILNTALDTLRGQLNHQPIGYNLLPEKFTMPELQKLYETILGKRLDRRNFQRKMLSYDILIKHQDRKKGVAHKAPYYYSFNLPNYKKALKEGLGGSW